MNKSLKVLIFSAIALVLLIGIYLFVWLLTNLQLIQQVGMQHLLYTMGRIVSRRSINVVAVIIAASLIAASTLMFQTMTNNKIVTPAILGFDAIYVLIQTLIVAFFAGTIFLNHSMLNFVISSIIMVAVVLLFYRLVYRKNQNNLVLLLLVGIIISTVARTFSTFFLTLLDPDNFSFVMSRIEVNLNNINQDIVYLALPISVILMFLMMRESSNLNVIELGEHHAINLGLDYHKKTNYYIILIALATAVATALVGPLSFLGLIAVNIAKQASKNKHHLYQFILGMIVAVIIILSAQVILELMGHITTVFVVISIIGGVYMLYLILKENRYA